MASKTSIEWTDSTWNPIRVRVKPNAAQIAYAKGYTSLVPIAEKMIGRVGQHCEHVSPGCEHCYAESNNHRCLPGNGTGLPYDRRSRDLVETFIDEKILLEPLKWREIREQGTGISRPRRIFPMNQSDIFAEWVTDEMRDRLFAVMALCPGSIFQVLTKRPGQMLAYMNGIEGHEGGYWRDALIEGSTQKLYSELHPKESYEAISLNLAVHLPLPNVWLGVSDEGNQHQRIDILRETPAAVRFISAEPLIVNPGTVNFAALDWVICGGESGAHSRPMHQQWARSLRDQCQAAGVPFFFKQWGAYSPAKDGKYIVAPDGHIRPRHETLTDRDCRMTRQTKKAAGALLDGREWKQFPEMTR